MSSTNVELALARWAKEYNEMWEAAEVGRPILEKRRKAALLYSKKRKKSEDKFSPGGMLHGLGGNMFRSSPLEEDEHLAVLEKMFIEPGSGKAPEVKG